ncbi:MAG: Fic family protein [Candidatus Sericytochromatia bacterium]
MPEPRYGDTGAPLRLKFPFKQAPQHISADDKKNGGRRLIEAMTQEKNALRLESRLAAKIMLLLEQDERGKAALASALGHKTVSGELHKQIKHLMASGYLVMTLPEKPNSRMQKYRLTTESEGLLNSLRLETSN